MSDDARKLILQRRAKFVAAAVASVGIGAASCEKEGPPPNVCLSQAPTQVDSGATGSESDTGASTTATDTGQPPMPCLSVAYPDPPPDDPANPSDAGPPPQPCLAPPPQPC